PQVVEIEEASFPLPWKAEFFLTEGQNPHGWLWVAEKDAVVVGYLCGWLVADEGEILRVAVHPASRRCGVGTVLLDKSIGIAGQRGVRTLHLEVRASNRSAIELYTSHGFREVGRRARYYENGEDALVMRWEGTAVREDS
ncbi:MAG: ribosomal protein S18-alanine N-acetyltransferase, partial [Deltaproteobacteria bacterium]|nr:ribosomal protein S18-alanine N-acetyltransferase [Deltaproteobacteria bacterium]